jgi:cell division protein FtsW
MVQRWIRVGGFTLQATSCQGDDGNFYRRLCVRRAEEVRNNIKGLVRLGGNVADGGLIIAEPDLGQQW